MASVLSPDLVRRLKQRVASLKAEVPLSGQSSQTTYLGGAFATTKLSLGGPSNVIPIGDPATGAELVEVERTLRLDLPEDLRQFYSETANGGFGPNDGLATLDEMVKRYHQLVSDPPGEAGQLWPTNLLPIGLAAPGVDCYDLESGQILFWDEESLAGGASDEVWKRSFKIIAATLSDWLETWLESPSQEEADRVAMEGHLMEGLRSSLEHWRSLTPAERAQMGLPETGWEKALFGHLGVDLDSL